MLPSFNLGLLFGNEIKCSSVRFTSVILILNNLVLSSDAVCIEGKIQIVQRLFI